MFKSAVFKLTAWYVGALMLVCLLFSLPFYNVASDRLRRGAEHQTEVVRGLPGQMISRDFLRQLESQREKVLDEDRRDLVTSIITINLLIIGTGAIASYLFARRTLKPIENAHNAQVRFTSDASHELRTPLAVMQTEIDVALRNKNLTSGEAKEILASNLEEVARLRNLSDQLLDLTKPQSELVLKTIKLDDLLNKEIKQLEKRHKIKISSDITKKITIKGDPTLLTQAINILVDNAVAYSDKKPEISLRLYRKNKKVNISVSDKGQGIKPGELDSIFERFYRGSDSTKLNPSGHGLGLPLAKNIISRHGGEITVKSSPGKGSEFTLMLV